MEYNPRTTALKESCGTAGRGRSVLETLGFKSESPLNNCSGVRVLDLLRIVDDGAAQKYYLVNVGANYFRIADDSFRMQN